MTELTSTPGTQPDLSVVIVNTDQFNTVRRTVHHLRGQTRQERIQILIVAESEAHIDFEPEEVAGFWGVDIIEVNPLGWVDHAQAAGIGAAQAPIIALLEDHAYPAPDWAEQLLRAHEGPWSVVGSAIANANPRTCLSWANLLIAYGTSGWVDPVEPGEIPDLPNHNIAYKREVLLGLEDLASKLERGSSLHSDLRAAGHRFYQTSARLYHTNPSLLRSVFALRFAAGRLYGAQRAGAEKWNAVKRGLYIGAVPLIPLVRLYRFKRNLIDANPAYQRLWPSILPAVFAGFLADAAGQAAGYAVGAGNALQRLADFEVDRMRHVTDADRRDAGYPSLP